MPRGLDKGRPTQIFSKSKYVFKLDLWSNIYLLTDRIRSEYGRGIITGDKTCWEVMLTADHNRWQRNRGTYGFGEEGKLARSNLQTFETISLKTALKVQLSLSDGVEDFRLKRCNLKTLVEVELVR